jgi:hypothetical protein
MKKPTAATLRPASPPALRHVIGGAHEFFLVIKGEKQGDGKGTTP